MPSAFKSLETKFSLPPSYNKLQKKGVRAEREKNKLHKKHATPIHPLYHPATTPSTTQKHKNRRKQKKQVLLLLLLLHPSFSSFQKSLFEQFFFLSLPSSREKEKRNKMWNFIHPLVVLLLLLLLLLLTLLISQVKSSQVNPPTNVNVKAKQKKGKGPRLKKEEKFVGFSPSL